MVPDASAAGLDTPGGVHVRFTDRSHGDLAVPRSGPTRDLEARRRAVVDLPWSWLRQVHGAGVVVVDAPGTVAGAEGDALVTGAAGAALAVHTADCGPVALWSDEGVIAAVHAGWRGLLAGVVEAAAEHMRRLGAERIHGRLGPTIGPECYEFGPRDLDAMAARFGDGVRATTATGAPALDVPAAVRSALAAAGVDDVTEAGTCTACSPRHWSHRAAGDAARHAVVVWRDP